MANSKITVAEYESLKRDSKALRQIVVETGVYATMSTIYGEDDKELQADLNAVFINHIKDILIERGEQEC